MALGGGTVVAQPAAAKYLGCRIHATGARGRRLIVLSGGVARMWQKLGLLCKMAADAVVRAKLACGCLRVNAFHMRASTGMVPIAGP